MRYNEKIARENNYDVLTNIFGEKIMIFEETEEFDSLLDVVLEAKDQFKGLRTGDVCKCYFPKLKNHQHRYGVIVKISGRGTFVMILGSTEGKDWEQYEANKLLHDWRVEGLIKETFAYTDTLVPPADVTVKSRCGKLTNGDYNRVVQPAIDKINERDMQRLISGESLEDIYKSIL